MAVSSTEIRIPKKGGNIRGVYSPEVAEILGGLGETETRRASRVDPTGDLTNEAKHWLRNKRSMQPAHLPKDAWWADLTPVDGPVLGPFSIRDTALSKEIEWLKANGLPFPSQD